MTRVKVCGITRAEDARAAVAAGADALGFIFCESPRRIKVEAAAAMREHLPPFVHVVGVFVDASPEEVLAVASRVRLTAVQLHGEESPEDAAAIARRIPVIKAFRVRSAGIFAEARRYAAASGYLFDAYVEGVAGGTGRRFDWELLKSDEAGKLDRPWILAGGLSPGNVEAALAACRPYAVDVSSGVEAGPGVKDHEKVSDFIARVRRFDDETSRVLR